MIDRSLSMIFCSSANATNSIQYTYRIMVHSQLAGFKFKCCGGCDFCPAQCLNGTDIKEHDMLFEQESFPFRMRRVASSLLQRSAYVADAPFGVEAGESDMDTDSTGGVVYNCPLGEVCTGGLTKFALPFAIIILTLVSCRVPSMVTIT